MKSHRNALLLVIASLVVWQGCGRKPPTPPAAEISTPQPVGVAELPTDPPPVASTATEPAESAVQDRMPTAPPDSSLRLPINHEMNAAIYLYRMDHDKLPPDFETLVKGKYLKAMPKPPPGKRFALDRNRMQVVVTD